jgi:hypothetical protein
MATDLPPALPPTAPASRPEAQSDVPSAERRRYSPPQLRHLGSVRDLTLGFRGGANETPGLMGFMKT